MVFFEDTRDLRGQLVDVLIDHTGPWSMSGHAVDLSESSDLNASAIPLKVL